MILSIFSCAYLLSVGMFICSAYLKNKVANFLIVEFLKFFVHTE